MWRNRDENNPDFNRPYKLAQVVMNYVRVYFDSCSDHINPNCKTLTQIKVKWYPPEPGWGSLNCDGALKTSSATAVCGGVFRDSNGRWIIGYARKMGSATLYY